MTTNARDEKWSEWKEWEGGPCPVDEYSEAQIKCRDGFINTGLGGDFTWNHHEQDGDIIAYRYKIKEPESDMHPDLEWLARNVSEWPCAPSGNDGSVRMEALGIYKHSNCVHAVYERSAGHSRKEIFTKQQWQTSRQQLGLDSTGIAEEDEEECLQLAYERMGDESVKVSIEELQDNVNKPKHYQLREGYEVYDLRQDLAAKAANGGATYDQYSDWDRAIEYIVRMWGKNRLEDAKKGRWYLDKLIGKLEDQG